MRQIVAALALQRKPFEANLRIIRQMEKFVILMLEVALFLMNLES
jgi:hypothetical protein